MDGEGSVGNFNDHRYVVIDSINGKSLKEVSLILTSLGIENNFYRFVFKKYFFYRIKISKQENLLRFNKVIGFNHPKRQKKLEEAIKSYKH